MCIWVQKSIEFQLLPYLHHYSLCQNNPYLPEKNDNLKKVQNLVHYDKMNGFSKKNQTFIEGILQKSTRWQKPWSKIHRIKKQTPL